MLMQTELVWLLGAVARGDETAFEQLYEATRAKLYGVLLRILGKPALAEEVMHEAYLKIWKMADRFDPATASPITWMVAIARNRAIDIVRKRGDVPVDEEPEVIEPAAEAPAPLARREMTAAGSIRKSSALCCSPIIAAGAAINWRRNLTSR